MIPTTLVTGACQNLGASIAVQLAKQGHSLAIHYNTSKDQAEAVAKQCKQIGSKASIIQGDFSTEKSTGDFIARYKETFPSTAHLVNNVGTFVEKSLSKTSRSDFESLLATNLLAPFQLIQHLLPTLKANKGTVTNIGMAGVELLKAYPYAAAYQIAKTSLFQLTKTYAHELASDGVRVNMVSPGILEHSADSTAGESLIPMGKVASFDEVARVVAFLIEESSNMITGQNIDVAGGLRLK